MENFRAYLTYIPALIIISLTLSLTNYCQGQEWLPVGSEWHFTNYAWGLTNGINHLEITGATEINGQPVQILERTKVTCDLRPKTEYLFERNDSLFYYEEQIEDFRLLYDFGAEAGDTFKIFLWEHMYPDSIYIRVDVDSITKFELNTMELNKFHVTYGYPQQDPDSIYFSLYHKVEIIEDIGSLVNLFHLYENGGCDEQKRAVQRFVKL